SKQSIFRNINLIYQLLNSLNIKVKITKLYFAIMRHLEILLIPSFSQSILTWTGSGGMEILRLSAI
ncbi:hypothetical protein, partial [Trichormus variabilis]|uniref:hypothetical protein n=1 Tax=Anabaena variabilis TaxID=264691 RepID=UPI001A9134FE